MGSGAMPAGPPGRGPPMGSGAFPSRPPGMGTPSGPRPPHPPHSPGPDFGVPMPHDGRWSPRHGHREMSPPHCHRDMSPPHCHPAHPPPGHPRPPHPRPPGHCMIPEGHELCMPPHAGRPPPHAGSPQGYPGKGKGKGQPPPMRPPVRRRHTGEVDDGRWHHERLHSGGDRRDRAIYQEVGAEVVLNLYDYNGDAMVHDFNTWGRFFRLGSLPRCRGGLRPRVELRLHRGP